MSLWGNIDASDSAPIESGLTGYVSDTSLANSQIAGIFGNTTIGFTRSNVVSGVFGVDVVEILNKMKVPFTKLSIEATAEQADTIPKVFSVIHMVYKADVDETQLDQFKRAVSLSHEKYCGISAMLAKTCPIHYTLERI